MRNPSHSSFTVWNPCQLTSNADSRSHSSIASLARFLRQVGDIPGVRFKVVKVLAKFFFFSQLYFFELYVFLRIEEQIQDEAKA